MHLIKLFLLKSPEFILLCLSGQLLLLDSLKLLESQHLLLLQSGQLSLFILPSHLLLLSELGHELFVLRLLLLQGLLPLLLE